MIWWFRPHKPNIFGKHITLATSTALFWPSITKYRPVIPYTDPVPPSNNQCRLLLTKYNQVPVSTTSYWPSSTKYHPEPPKIDAVPLSTSKYCLLLTQYHQIPTSTTPYWFGTTKYQPVPTYTVVDWGLQTPAQFTPGLVLTFRYQVGNSIF